MHTYAHSSNARGEYDDSTGTEGEGEGEGKAEGGEADRALAPQKEVLKLVVVRGHDEGT